MLFGGYLLYIEQTAESMNLLQMKIGSDMEIYDTVKNGSHTPSNRAKRYI